MTRRSDQNRASEKRPPARKDAGSRVGLAASLPLGLCGEFQVAPVGERQECRVD